MILKRFILPILIVPLFFLGCASQEEIQCYLPKITASNNSPVVSGQSIFLKTPSSEDELTVYHWTGPNGFQSNEFNPVILNATPQMAGDYKLMTSKGICKSNEVTTSVSVEVNSAPCIQDNNTVTYDGSNYSFYSNTSNAIPNNEYKIRAGGSTASITLIFQGDKKPLTGTYTIANKSTPLSSGTIHVRMDFRYGYDYVADYYAKSGSVLVYYDKNGNTIVKFCSVPFSFNTNTSTDSIGSTMFTVEK